MKKLLILGLAIIAFAGFMSKFNIGVNTRSSVGLSKLDKQKEDKVYKGVFQFGLMYFFKALV